MEALWALLLASGAIILQGIFLLLAAVALVYFLLKRIRDKKNEQFEKRKF